MRETTTNTNASDIQQQNDNNISQTTESHANTNNKSEPQQQHEINTNIVEKEKDEINSKKENRNIEQQPSRKPTFANNKVETTTTTTTTIKKETNTSNKKSLIQLTVKGQKISLVNPNKKRIRVPAQPKPLEKNQPTINTYFKGGNYKLKDQHELKAELAQADH